MKYRAEIDGLRAIAVVPVVMFHAGFSLVPGGFVGVDVFFVISGYLISRQILDDLSSGRFSFANFYERRARRILPALLFVLAASFGLGYILLAPSEMKEFSKTMAGAAMSVSNFVLASSSGYFDVASELKPLLHTWSLSVEEQFYAAYPLLIYFIWRNGRISLQTAISSAMLLSLGISEWLAQTAPSSSYYMLHSRAWELLAGAHCALPATVAFNRTSLHAPLSLLGLGLLIASMGILDANVAFPGFHAVAPVLGTVLVIFFGNSGTLVARLLGTPVLVWLGSISYSLYLWHQPILAFIRLHNFGVLTPVWQVGALASLIPISYLTWRLIERPFRRGHLKRRELAAAATGGVVTLSFLALVAYKTNGLESRFRLPATLANSFSRTERGPECFDLASSETSSKSGCQLGRPGSNSFILFGDSHALSVLPVFDRIATDHGVGGMFFGQSRCPPLMGVYSVSKKAAAAQACLLLNRRVLEYAESSGSKLIFLVARWSAYTDGGYDGNHLFGLSLTSSGQLERSTSRHAFAAGLEASVRAYRSAAIRVVVLGQVPEQRFAPRDVYYRAISRGSDYFEHIDKLAVTEDQHMRLQQFSVKAFQDFAARGEIEFLDPRPAFCSKGRCSMGTAQSSYYIDNDHLSLPGADVLSSRVAEAFEANLNGRRLSFSP